MMATKARQDAGNTCLMISADEKYDALTPEELEALVPGEMRAFYRDLERRCKRFQPEHFVPAVISLMRGQLERGKFANAPYHQIALMIEANCAFTRGQNNDQLDWSAYAKIKNIFHDRPDSGVVAAIRRGIDWFILAMQREQLELQKGHSPYDVSNSLDLYVHDQLAAEMETELGMSPERWVSVSLANWSTACKPEVVVIRPVIEGSDKTNLTVSEAELKHVLTRMSRTPSEIGERFKRLRETTPPIFHSHIRSTFWDRPFIRFSEAYCSPFPGIAFRSMFSELYRVAKGCNSFDPAFSNSMESVVERTIGFIPEANRVWTNRDLESATVGKSCDFLVEADEYNLFVECKAVSFTRNRVIPDVVEHDGSTRALQKGHIQIQRTCKEYNESGIRGLLSRRDVPNIGFVVTFGDIPFANAPWYYKRFLKARVDRKIGHEDKPDFAGRGIPFSMSLEMLQVLVVYLRDSGKNLLDTVREYGSIDYVVTGDWDAFISQRLKKSSNSDSGLPFVRANNDMAISRLLPTAE